MLQIHRHHQDTLLSKFTQPQQNEDISTNPSVHLVEKLKQTSPYKIFRPIVAVWMLCLYDFFLSKSLQQLPNGERETNIAL